MASVAIQFVYRRIPTTKSYHPDIDNEWRARDIKVANISDDGIMCIKFPVYLHEYDIQFSIKCIDQNTLKYMSLSNFYKVKVPSFLTYIKYNIGDIVYFRDKDEFHISSEGQIIEKVDEDTFKLSMYNTNVVHIYSLYTLTVYNLIKNGFV